MSFDFDAAVLAPFRMQPGLRRLAPGSAPQLTPAIVPHRGAARHLREKLAVLWAYRDQALLCAPGFDPQPALAGLAAHAATEHPQAFAVEADGSWFARWLGWRVGPRGQAQPHDTSWPEIGDFLQQLPPAWRQSALLMLAFAEDLAIVDGRSGTLPWLAVALPSGWAPEDKIGLHFAAVHAPVADNQLLLSAADHLVKLGTGAQRWERFVWTLTSHPRLHAHPRRLPQPRWPSGLTAQTIAAQTWWRTERQTFIPVATPQGPQAVFTIQVDTVPLAQALQPPAQAAHLHDALAALSAAVLAYREL
ncbi:MAG: hypothetical protein CFE45_25820, partial [Burkholderiales bacterium PBB5]